MEGSARGWRPWLVAALLACPIVLWPLVEVITQPQPGGIFLPYVKQMDLTFHLSWIARLCTDAAASDLSLWEHRHAAGNPNQVVFLWPFLMSRLIRAFGGAMASYWLIVYLCHVVWLWACQRLVRSWLTGDAVAWAISVFFVFLCLPLGMNLFLCGPKPWNWTLLCLYENYRGFPTAIGMAVNMVALWRLWVAWETRRRGAYILAGACVALTPYARPFDWMVLTTFLGLLVIHGLYRKDGRDWRGWIVSGLVCLLVSVPFLVLYGLWAHAGTQAYQQAIERQVLQGRNVLHFVKYGLMTAGITGGLAGWWILVRRIAGGTGSRDEGCGRFLVLLTLASFLPYFQHAFSGRTLNSYQYYFIYFTVPLCWLSLLVGLARILGKRVPSLPAGVWVACAAGAGLLSQLLLLGIPQATRERFRHDERQTAIYEKLKAVRDPVILSAGSFSSGTSSDLILRSGAWSFVPMPMAYSYGSMAPTSELVERLLLGKLLLTGRVSDLSEVFSERGMKGYEIFWNAAPPELKFWLDRLAHCPGMYYFVFDPKHSLKDLEIRGLHPPAERLRETESFAYFGKECREAFRKVAAMEAWPIERQTEWIASHYRLTHVLLTPSEVRLDARLRSHPEMFRVACSTPDGSVLWQLWNPKETQAVGAPRR